MLKQTYVKSCGCDDLILEDSCIRYLLYTPVGFPCRLKKQVWLIQDVLSISSRFAVAGHRAVNCHCKVCSLANDKWNRVDISFPPSGTDTL